MRVLKWLVLVLVIIIAISVVTLVFWGGHVIKEGVNRVGPQVLGVPVELQEARFHPFRGHVSLNGMFVGNPEGFRTDSLFEMSQLEIDLDVKSLFTDTIIINRILIDSPRITYEVGARRTNLGTLLRQLEGEEDPDAPEEEPEIEPVEEVEPGKHVVIKELVLADARAQVSATAMRGRVVPVQLSTITLTDLGGEDQSLTQIATEVVKAVAGAVGNAVAGAGDLLGEGLQSALEGVGAIGGRAADGARAVTGAAGDGTRAVTGAVGDRARGLRDRVTGRDEEKDDAEETEAPDKVDPEAELLDDTSEKAIETLDKVDEEVRSGSERVTDAVGGLLRRDREEKE